MSGGVNNHVVLAPGAPVLVPELAGAAHTDSRAHVEHLIRMLRAAASGAQAVQVWGTDSAGRRLGEVAGTLRRWGVDVPVGRGESVPDEHVPDSALLGWWLLDRSGTDLPRRFVPVPDPDEIRDDVSAPRTPAVDPDRPGPDTLVLFVADGPAALTPKAPIPLDDRAVELDRALREWIVSGGRLPDPGVRTAQQIGWWSRPAWLALAALLGGSGETDAVTVGSAGADPGPAPAAQESTSWAPYGVGYHAARWQVTR